MTPVFLFILSVSGREDTSSDQPQSTISPLVSRLTRSPLTVTLGTSLCEDSDVYHT